MEIYFVLYYPGYWKGFVTTNKDLAMKKMAEDPTFRLEKTEIKPVDFIPQKATWCGSMGSTSADIERIKLENYHCFLPVYNKNEKQSNWYQCVHNSDLIELEKGIEVRDPEENLLGTVLYICKLQ